MTKDAILYDLREISKKNSVSSYPLGHAQMIVTVALGGGGAIDAL